MAETKVVWGIHTTQENLFLPKNIIGIGWEEMGDINCAGDNRDDIKKRYAEVYPEATSGSISTCVGMLYRFVYEVRVGDYVVFVTLSDYTANAKAYLEQHPIIRGLNGSEVVDLVLRYYDKLDDKYQNMISLKRVYIPVMKNAADSVDE